VLYSGVNETFKPVGDAAPLQAVRARYGLGQRPFILAVGTLQPRKNYARLIRAFAQIGEADLALVIAGGRGWLYDEIFAEVQRLGLGPRVIFPGFVADQDLPALYSAAAVLAYPSIYEGFGLPILEAFACGTPVVSSNASCLPEVAGDAALLIDPTDVAALAEALTRALTDTALRAQLTAAGLARAQQFTWQAAAQQLLAEYRALTV
ncbi:MAG TPA: glycosyltransferase family 1 protein, partial [Aggregatilineales bacterium]|nr:glycosyltransferase family 1 protein [Aggregatilineales bacterium]